MSVLNENGIRTTEEDDGGVNALVAMHRLQSAQARTPIVVEDKGKPTARLALNVNLPLAANQKQQRPAKLFAPSFDGPQSGFGAGTVSMDGVSSPARLPRGGLTSSAPRLIPNPDGLRSGMFGDIDSARVNSSGAK